LFVEEGGHCVPSGFFELSRGSIEKGRLVGKQCWGGEPHDGIHPGSKNEDFLFPEVSISKSKTAIQSTYVHIQKYNKPQ
jgi:hypothetical protein